MKHLPHAASLLLTTAFVSTAMAAPAVPAAPARAQQHAEAPRAPAQRLAYDFFSGDWRGEHHGRRHHDDDDDDEEGARDRDGARPADPNAADAPVPDNGVFNGARPKVEVK